MRVRRQHRLRAQPGPVDARLTRLTYVATGLCAALGLVAGFLMLAESQELRTLLLPVAFVCVSLPILQAFSLRRAPRDWLGSLAIAASCLAHALILGYLSSLGFTELAVCAGMLMTGALLERAGNSACAIGVVLLSIILTDAATRLAPGKASTALFASSVLAASLAITCLSSRDARRRCSESNAPSFPEPERPLALAARVGGATLVGLLVLLVTLVVHTMTNAPPKNGPAANGSEPPRDPAATQERPAGSEPPRPESKEPKVGEGSEDGEPSGKRKKPSGASRPPPPPGGAGERPEDGAGAPPTLPPPDLLDLMRSMMQPDVPGARQITVADYLAGQTQTIVAGARERGWQVFLAVLTQILLVLWLLRRRLRRALVKRGIGFGGARAPDFYFDKLERVLETYGHRRLASQTPRELTRSVVKARGHLFAPCDEVSTLLYRSHYGAQELTREERRRIEDIIRALESRQLAELRN